MIVKDWILLAAAEIASLWPVGEGGHGEPGYLTDEQRDNIAVNLYPIIAKHCPMKEGEAWMKVPRCETCAWWHGPQKDADGSEQCTEPSISPHQMDEFMTQPDFGCVQWREK